jgi:hypothetical protein
LTISPPQSWQQFINTAVGKAVVAVGHDLEPCTTTIQHIILPHPGDHIRRIILIDTPGFDDCTNLDDAWKPISHWLEKL